MRHLLAVVAVVQCMGIAAGARAQTAPPPPPAPRAEKSNKLSFVAGKWQATLYGFIEADSIVDSTRSFNDLAGNAAIARPGTYGGDHGRTTFGVRNSRIGLKLRTPDLGVVKTTAVLEMDFFGNQPPNASEAAFFTSPTFRIRHAAIKVEDPYVDVLLGQSWSLFGWQSYFHPASVEIQGLPGQVYSRTPQIRLSHTFSTDAVNIELAAAAQRPAERDSMVPDGAAGLRVLFNRVKALHTAGSAGTGSDPAGIGVSGLVRRFAIPEFAAMPAKDAKALGWGVSVDAMVPIIPRTLERRDNALTLTGSFVRGAGIADQYSGLTGGIAFPSLPTPAGMTTAPTYPADIDNGLVTFDAKGRLHAVDWQSFMVGVQYYLPPSGRVWIAANYSEMRSANAAELGARDRVFDRSRWADANLFWDPTDALRFGLEYAYFEQTYADGVKAHNHRGQLSGFFIF